MSKRKVCVVITARPSYARVKTALQAIKDHPELELQLVVTGSALLDKYGNTVKIIEEDGFKVDERVFAVLDGTSPTTMAKTTGLALMELATAFHNLKPDIVLTIGDRYETIANAISASYMNIPLAHIMGGEITGNIDEKVRHSITKLADIHLVSSEKAQERVIRMGEDKEYVYNTGCPSIDLAAGILNNPLLDYDPFIKYNGVGPVLDITDGYIVVMQHPVTNEHEEAKKQITITLEAINELKIPTMWFWPNVDAGGDGTSSGIRAFREKYNPEHIHFFKNMDPIDFYRLLYNSKCLVGNSSVGIRECAYLGVPVVDIGTRQIGRDRGKNVIDVPHDKEAIINAVKTHLNNGNYGQDLVYGEANAGEKIANILAVAPLRSHKKLNYE